MPLQGIEIMVPMARPRRSSWVEEPVGSIATLMRRCGSEGRCLPNRRYFFFASPTRARR